MAQAALLQQTAEHEQIAQHAVAQLQAGVLELKQRLGNAEAQAAFEKQNAATTCNAARQMQAECHRTVAVAKHSAAEAEHRAAQSVAQAEHSAAQSVQAAYERGLTEGSTAESLRAGSCVPPTPCDASVASPPGAFSWAPGDGLLPGTAKTFTPNFIYYPVESPTVMAPPIVETKTFAATPAGITLTRGQPSQFPGPTSWPSAPVGGGGNGGGQRPQGPSGPFFNPDG